MSNSLAPVVAVLNMKGGVGKTTVSAHVMRVLYQAKKVKTLLVDLDPQFNLTQALVPRMAYDKLALEGKTIFSAMEPAAGTSLFEVDTISASPPHAKDLAHRLRWFDEKPVITSLDLIAGDFRLVKYSMIRDSGKLDIVQERFLRFINEARKEYQLVCIDCNPSSSFITSCALHSASHLLVPVRPDRYSVLGLELLTDLVEQIPSVHPKPTTLILLNSMGTDRHDRDIENELRGHKSFGANVLAHNLRHSGLLRARIGYTGFATDKGVAHTDRLRREITALAQEIAKKLGI